MWDALRTQGRWSGEIWDRRKNGDVYPKWMTINAVIDDTTGKITHYIALFADITERKAAEAHIKRLAHHDALTGLANRFTLEARLGQALANAQRYGKQVAVIFIDLDRFKNINDSLGHHVGDAMLTEVARRLTRTIRDSDTAARLGGDEFVLILPDIDNTAVIAAIAGKLISALTQPIDALGYTLHTSGSLGIAVFPNDGDGVETIMKNADTAMYHAKAQGRNNYQFFAADMNASASARLTLEGKLREALEKSQFELHYQPQVALATGDIVGVEALIRWRHPQDGLIPPDQFIPVAEESGLIQGIGDWVIAEACRQLKVWSDTGLPPLRMAINLSAKQLRGGDVMLRIKKALTDNGLLPNQLELEITESSIMERPQEAVALLKELADMGVSLAIDDFGTGYSSLAYLKLFPIDRLKIDRSFVKDIESDYNDRAIALGTIALAHSLGLQVVAEGIETMVQQSILGKHGCEEAQGYWYSRPLPAADLEALITRTRTLPENPEDRTG
jgi:diguanylate cyclase (GGDEF)-like protein